MKLTFVLLITFLMVGSNWASAQDSKISKPGLFSRDSVALDRRLPTFQLQANPDSAKSRTRKPGFIVGGAVLAVMGFALIFTANEKVLVVGDTVTIETRRDHLKSWGGVAAGAAGLTMLFHGFGID